MNLADAIKLMRTAGLNADQILNAIEEQEAERAAKRREVDAERQRRHRAAKAVTHVTRDERDVRDMRDTTPAHIEHASAPGGDNPSTVEPTEGKTPSLRSGVAPPRKPSPRSELETVLDVEHADAVLEHRQRKKAPLTAHAAKLLAKSLAKWPGGANEAADIMIEAGWSGFEVAWAENRKVPQNGRDPPPRQPNMSAKLAATCRPPGLPPGSYQ